MIDCPVNTNDYKVPHRQNQVGPTQSVVEVHKPYLAPPDPEESMRRKENQFPVMELGISKQNKTIHISTIK